MSTEYVLRVTIAAPIAMTADANALAVCLGESPGDAETFSRATHVDADGNEYSVASTLAKPAFTEMAGVGLVAPPYAPDVDIEAAGRAQQSLKFEGSAVPDKLNVFIGERWDKASSHLAMMGLTQLPSEVDN